MAEILRFVDVERERVLGELSNALSLEQAPMLIIEPDEPTARFSERLIRASFSAGQIALRIARATTQAAALGCQHRDVWLIQLAVDHPGLDGRALCSRLRYRFPHSVIVARSVASEPPRPSLPLLAGADYLVSAPELACVLPSLVVATLVKRRHLASELVDLEVGRRVAAAYGTRQARKRVTEESGRRVGPIVQLADGAKVLTSVVPGAGRPIVHVAADGTAKFGSATLEIVFDAAGNFSMSVTNIVLP